jgi:hypothetical protein
MLLNDGIKFKGSLLQFKHKAAFMVNNYILDPSGNDSKNNSIQLDPISYHKYYSK